MSQQRRRPPVTDQQLDDELRDFLAWHAHDLSGAPTAHEMTMRLTGVRRHTPMWRSAPRVIATLLMVALLGALAAAIVILSRPSPPLVRLLGNGEIVVSSDAYDPITGDRVTWPCPCPGGVAITADGQRVASIRSGSIVVTDLRMPADPRVVGPCDGCTDHLPSIAMSGDGRFLAYPGPDGITLFDLEAPSGSPPLVIDPGHLVADVAISPDGEHLASLTGGEPTVRVWTRTGDPLPSIDLPEPASGVAWSPDGRQLALLMDTDVAGGYDLQAWTVDVDGATATPQQVWHLPGCCMNFGGIGWAPDGRSLAVVAKGLWVIPLDRGTPRRIAEMTATSRPAWRPVAVTAGPIPSSEPAGSPPPGLACAALDLPATVASLPYPAWSVPAGGQSGRVAWTPVGGDATAWGWSPSVPGPDGSVLTVAALDVGPDGTPVLIRVTVGHPDQPLDDCTDLWLVGLDGFGRRISDSGPMEYVDDGWLAPAGSTVAWLARDTKEALGARMLHVAHADGDDQVIGPPPCASAWRWDRAMARDASQLAVVCDAHVLLVDLRTGETRPVDLPDGPHDVAGIGWGAATAELPSGPLLVVRTGDAAAGLVLDSIDPVTGTATRLGPWLDLDGERIEWMVPFPGRIVAPDGRSVLAFGGAPGQLPGAEFAETAYRIDLTTGELALVPGSEGIGSTAIWTVDGRLELMPPYPAPSASPDP